MPQRRQPERPPRRPYRTYRQTETTREIIIPALILILLAALAAYAAHQRRQEQHTRNAVLEQAAVSVHFIDVGQGDSIYINSGDTDVLIDAGEAEYGDTVVRYLQHCGVEELELVIASHPHSDHIGGLSAVLEAFETAEVLMSDIPDEQLPVTRSFESLLYAIDLSGAALTTAEAGQTYPVGEAELRILGPVEESYTDLNDFSVVAQLSCGKVDFLFTGDQTTTAEKDLIGSGRLSEIEVLKVGHHGSATSSAKAFLDILQPAYAVIMCGADNSYHHPSETVVSRLLGYTERIYRTDVQGTTVFATDGKAISVSVEKEGL